MLNIRIEKNIIMLLSSLFRGKYISFIEKVRKTGKSIYFPNREDNNHITLLKVCLKVILK